MFNPVQHGGPKHSSMFVCLRRLNEIPTLAPAALDTTNWGYSGQPTRAAQCQINTNSKQPPPSSTRNPNPKQPAPFPHAALDATNWDMPYIEMLDLSNNALTGV